MHVQMPNIVDDSEWPQTTIDNDAASLFDNDIGVISGSRSHSRASSRASQSRASSHASRSRVSSRASGPPTSESEAFSRDAVGPGEDEDEDEDDVQLPPSKKTSKV